MGASAMTEQQRAEYMAIVAAVSSTSAGNLKGDADRLARWAWRIWESADSFIEDGDIEP